MRNCVEHVPIPVVCLLSIGQSLIAQVHHAEKLLGNVSHHVSEYAGQEGKQATSKARCIMTGGSVTYTLSYNSQTNKLVFFCSPRSLSHPSSKSTKTIIYMVLYIPSRLPKVQLSPVNPFGHLHVKPGSSS